MGCLRLRAKGQHLQRPWAKCRETTLPRPAVEDPHRRLPEARFLRTAKVVWVRDAARIQSQARCSVRPWAAIICTPTTTCNQVHTSYAKSYANTSMLLRVHLVGAVNLHPELPHATGDALHQLLTHGSGRDQDLLGAFDDLLRDLVVTLRHVPLARRARRRRRCSRSRPTGHVRWWLHRRGRHRRCHARRQPRNATPLLLLVLASTHQHEEAEAEE